MRPVISLLVSGLIFVLGGAAAQAPKELPKAGTIFTFERAQKIGSNWLPSDERWTYTHQVVEVGDEITILEVGRTGQRTFKPMRDLQFPLSVGSTWNHRNEFQRMDPSGQPSTYVYSGEAKVVGGETITFGDTPVATFRIEFNGWVNRQGRGQLRKWQYSRIDWYAPALGYVIQSDFKESDGRPIVHNTFRLIKVDAPAR